MDLRHYLLLSVVSMALFAVDESLFPLTLAMMAWLGVVLALRLRPGLQAIRADRRLPRAGELAALLIGQGGALGTFALLGVLPTVPLLLQASDPAPILTEAIPTLVFGAAAAAPIWFQILRAGRHPGLEPPLWPSAVGLFAGAALGLGSIYLVVGVLEPLLEEYRFSENLIGPMMAAPSGLLITTFAGGWIVQALRGRPEGAPVFRAAVTVALVAWALVAVALVLDVTGGLGLLRSQGGALAAGFTVVIALAWIRALLVIRRTEVESVISSILIVVVLFYAFLFSLVVPAWIPHDMWASLAAVAASPFLLGTALLVAFAVPPIVRRLVWNPRRFPWARRAAPDGPGVDQGVSASAAAPPTGRCPR